VTAYLLDTNALLWLGLDQGALKPSVRAELFKSELFVSIISAVEIAIKTSIGKLTLPSPFLADFSVGFEALVRRAAINVLPLELATVDRLRQLPLHHRDPFDRIIIAEAIERGLTVATRDRSFHAYGGLNILDI
jgi:PIN domain nuclease of toxin-antitoxin system